MYRRSQCKISTVRFIICFVVVSVCIATIGTVTAQQAEEPGIIYDISSQNEGDVQTYSSKKSYLFVTSDQVTIGLNQSKMSGTVISNSWDVSGPATVEKDDTLQVDFTSEGIVTVNSTVVFSTSGTQTTKYRNITLSANTLHTELPHFEYQLRDNVANEPAFAKGQDRHELLYRRVSQRVGTLPDNIEVIVVDEETMIDRAGGSYAGYAIEPDTILIKDSITYNWQTGVLYGQEENILKHELVHLAQYKMDSASSGEWEFLSEGHARFEESPALSAEVLSEKPTLSFLRGFDAELQRDYTEPALFVAAFYAEYGRQDFLELMENSDSEDLDQEFERVTGDSFESFHSRWKPTVRSEGPNAIRRTRLNFDQIRRKPMFEYHKGNLSIIRPPSYQVSWDVDSDGNYERTGETINWAPETAGDHDISAKYTNGNQSLSQTQTISISASETVTQVEISSVTISPQYIEPGSTGTHTLTFETEGVSADGNRDSFEISFPDKITLEGVSDVEIDEQSSSVTQTNNKLSVSVNPDGVGSTQISGDLKVELSAKNSTNTS